MIFCREVNFTLDYFKTLLFAFRITCRLWGKVISVALQCWMTPWASSCAFKWSAQVKGWEEVKRSRVLILQSTGNSVLSEDGISDSDNDTCEVFRKQRIQKLVAYQEKTFNQRKHWLSLEYQNLRKCIINNREYTTHWKKGLERATSNC